MAKRVVTCRYHIVPSRVLKGNGTEIYPWNLCLYPLVPCNEIRTIFICITYVLYSKTLLELSALRRKLCDFHTVRQTVAIVL